jgi:2-polyprenyl-3-methyl-5-hydroxy-6-metoxy-1,4-benzoquinol methylase
VRSDDPAAVREQYAREVGLAARASIYGGDGVDARDTVMDVLRPLGPRRLLEVGCGWGELADRMAAELDCAVVAIDQSRRMVELARERGVDAHVGDIEALEFGDAEFDAVVAAWMLYHVADLDRGLRECARVLRPGGALVAVTNAAADFAELWDLVGRDTSARLLTFRAENGETILRRHFDEVVRHDLASELTFADADAIRRYVGSSIAGREYVGNIPELDEPFVARKLVTVFVASKRRLQQSVARES